MPNPSLFIFFVIVVDLLICFVAAQTFQEIAEMKGHTEKRYFWWCFLTGLPGWLMVVALPDLSARPKQTTTPSSPTSASTTTFTGSEELPYL